MLQVAIVAKAVTKDGQSVEIYTEGVKNSVSVLVMGPDDDLECYLLTELEFIDGLANDISEEGTCLVELNEELVEIMARRTGQQETFAFLKSQL